MSSTKVLQKYIADSGLFSRRRAESLIKQGRVRLNGRIAELGERAGQEDLVTIDGSAIKPISSHKYIILNKPAGYVCTNRNFPGENCLFDLLRNEHGRLPAGALSIAGRLDKMSEGLVLLTNDGDLAHQLTHPRFGHEKEYLVKVSDSRLPLCRKQVKKIITEFKKGVDIGEGEIGKAKKADYTEEGIFKLILTEGKKRQIRRMFAFFNLEVSRLRRIRIGSNNLEFKLGCLKPGEWKYTRPANHQKT